MQKYKTEDAQFMFNNKTNKQSCLHPCGIAFIVYRENTSLPGVLEANRFALFLISLISPNQLYQRPGGNCADEHIQDDTQLLNGF